MSLPTIGFIGTGTITAAMARGLAAHPPLATDILVSPRNGETARLLAAEHASIRIARDNQDVVDGSDVLVLAVRPQVAQDVVQSLRFRAGQAVLSVIAATDREALTRWIDADVRLTQATPLPFVARRAGVTAIFPPDPEVMRLFSALGTAVGCRTKAEYDVLTAASAVMATYFGFMHEAQVWIESNGVPSDGARAYIVSLFAELSQTARLEAASPLDRLAIEFATRGGLNEQLATDFRQAGGFDALVGALDGVHRRITDRKAI